MTTWQVNKWKMGDFKPIIIEEIVIFIIDYGYRAKWKLIRYAIIRVITDRVGGHEVLFDYSQLSDYTDER